MRQDITWVGLDTSKKDHAVAVLDPGSDEPRTSTVNNEPVAPRKDVRIFAS